MNLSRRHHYIPKFYLKGFTGSDNKFAIFDIERNVLKKGLHSVKSHFFEFDRNTLLINGEKTDFLEDTYQVIEDKLKVVFEEFQEVSSPNEITDLNLFNILTFINSIFWRIPVSDGKLNKLMQNLSLQELGFSIIDTKTGKSAPEEFINQIKSDPNFIESYRAAYPIINYLKNKDNLKLDNWRVYDLKNEGKGICGDFPIVLRESDNLNILSNEILFPLTKNLLLVRTKNTNTLKELTPEFKFKLDLLIFMQSKKFVCSLDREYLLLLSKLKEKNKTRFDIIKCELFEYLDRKTGLTRA